MGKRFCKEIKVGTNGLVCITNAVAPQQSLLLELGRINGQKLTFTWHFLWTSYLLPLNLLTPHFSVRQMSSFPFYRWGN